MRTFILSRRTLLDNLQGDVLMVQLIKRIELTVLQLTKILCYTLLPHRSKVFVYFYFCLEVTCSV